MPSKFLQFKPFSLLLISSLSISSTQADIHNADERSLFEFDIPEVTAASRLPQLLTDAPASMTVITRSTIEASGARSLPDLLRLVPGMQVFMTGSNQYGATYHGATDNHPGRMEVMIDGRSVYIPLVSTTIWETLAVAIEDIERVEIVRGSNAATHGSNAFMGAINFITRNPLLDNRVEVQGSVGSMNTRQMRASFSRDSSLGSYRLAVNHDENDGSQRFRDGLSRQFVHFSAQMAPSLIDTIDINLGYDQGDIISGRLRSPNAYTVNRGHRSDFQSLKWQRDLSSDSRLHMMIYRNRLKLNEAPPSGLDALQHQAGLINLTRQVMSLPQDLFSDQQIADGLVAANPGGLLLAEHGNTSMSDAEVRFDFVPHGRYRNSAALGIRKEQASSSMLFHDGKVSRDKVRVFNHGELLVNSHFTMNAGLLHEHAISDQHATSYRAALLWKPQTQTAVRFGYSHSERIPSLLESERNYTIYKPFTSTPETLLLNSVRSPNLRREQIQSKELGIYHLFNDTNYVDLRLFNESISDGIHPWRRQEDRALMYANHAELRNRGLEIQYSRQLPRNLRLLVNYNYTDSQHNQWDQGQGERFTPAGPLTPRHTASMMLHWKPTADWSMSVTHYYMDRVHWTDNHQHVVIPSYNRTDLQLAKSWTLDHDSTFALSLIVQNLSGKQYQEFYPYNEFDRRAWITARLIFR
ncbi:TonB-dependent receptor plug domain-containing protein [Nitrincola sp. MINF-07-Sa-05]|uniref:TonB-dependent receptor plug domain-containing protein n=1 Tax=Nitrincola salilacus TaxID=3400273 RepID=UPI003918418A